jgi:hypothetical protein
MEVCGLDGADTVDTANGFWCDPEKELCPENILFGPTWTSIIWLCVGGGA